MTLTPAKAVALVVFLGAVAGATYGVQTIVDERLEGSLLTVDALHENRNATGGHAVTLAFHVLNRDDAARDAVVLATAAGVEARSDVVSVPGQSTLAVFLTFDLPEGVVPAAYPVDAQLLDASGAAIRTRSDVATLTVLPPAAEAFAAGDAATLRYTGVLEESDKVFETNDPALAGRTFLRTTDFEQSSGELRLAGARPPSFPPGLYDALIGMQPGESRTVTLEPDAAYGPATLNTTRPRTEPVERTMEVPLSNLPPLPRAQFEALIAQTGQGDAADYGVGKRFYETDPDTGNRFWFVITNLTEQGVIRKFDPSVGERFTTILAWPNATRVSEVNETSVRLIIDPPFEVGEPFTFYEYWPQKSAIKSVNETEIVIEHSPDIGMSNEVRDPTGRSARRFTVESLTEDEIVLRYPSPNPLAGRTLTYHVTLLSLEKASG